MGPSLAVKPEEPPVDLECLQEMGGDDPILVRELVVLYLAQADEVMAGLQAALQAHSAANVAFLAHKLAGASSTCGMMDKVAPLRELDSCVG